MLREYLDVAFTLLIEEHTRHGTMLFEALEQEGRFRARSITPEPPRQAVSTAAAPPTMQVLAELAAWNQAK